MKKDWKYIPLKEVCSVQNGFAFDSKLFGTSGCPLIRIRDIKRGYSETYTSESVDDSYLVNNGDILIGMDGDFNIAEWNGGKAFLNQRVCKLIPSNNLLSRYALYFLPKELNSINSKTTFSTVKHLSSKQVLAISIPVPPLPEQQQIVDYLDGAFAKIDQLKANAEKQLQDAQSLFSAALEDAMSPKAGWEEKTLGEIAKDVKYGTSKPASLIGEYAYLRMNNITSEGFLNINETKRISLSEKELENCIVRKGDILFNRTNSLEHVGKTCVFNLDTPMVIAGYIIRIRLADNINSQFISYFMNMKSTKEYLRCLFLKSLVTFSLVKLKNLSCSYWYN